MTNKELYPMANPREEDPANPKIGSQSEFDLFVGERKRRLSAEDAGLYLDIYPMSGAERDLQREGHSMPTEVQHEGPTDDDWRSYLGLHTGDPLEESYNMPPISEDQRNAGPGARPGKENKV